MDLALRIFAAIGVLTTLAVTALFATAWLGLWRVKVRKKPSPNADLPAIPPDEYMALHADFEAWERGERP